MIIPVLLFILGLVLLIKGGDFFVDSSVNIAKRFHVPDILIGATVVSIGTTLPEVMVSASSALKGSGSIAYGNAIGSIICNTALIAALTVAIKPATIQKKDLKIPVIFFFIAAIFYSAVAYISGYFSRIIGILLLTIFAVYITLQVKAALKTPAQSTDKGSEEPENSSIIKDIIMLVIGAATITVGANLLVNNGQIIAAALGVPEAVIALTFVALGTSLPELVTAITSLVKGHGALSLGNVIGANLFNLILVSGVSVTLAPFAIPSDNMIAGKNASLILDIPLMFFVMVFLTVPALIKGKLSRYQGVILLVVYASYCIFQFVK